VVGEARPKRGDDVNQLLEEEKEGAKAQRGVSSVFNSLILWSTYPPQRHLEQAPCVSGKEQQTAFRPLYTRERESERERERALLENNESSEHCNAVKSSAKRNDRILQS